MRKVWTQQEENELRELYGTMTAEALAVRFGTTYRAIYQKCNKLGLKKGYDHAKIKLSDRDTLWLRLNFPHMRNEICAMHLGVSLRTVVRIARTLNLVKTPQFMRECQDFTARKAKESHLRNGTFPKKGYYSPNLQKGAKYQFKPGHKPVKLPF